MPRQYTPRVTCACARCGLVVHRPPSSLKPGRAVYCSVSCARTRHGESHDALTPEYRAWAAMKRRCLNPHSANYPDYGGRGITICDRWLASYEAFLADVGRRPTPDHSLDRTDNDLGYAPGNVRWSTRPTQQRNRRSVRLLAFGGETRCLREWATVVGATEDCLRARLDAGWSVERTLTTLLMPRRSRRSH